MIEARRVAFQVPFTDHGRAVTGLLKKLRERDLTAIERFAVVAHAVLMAVSPRQDDPRGSGAFRSVCQCSLQSRRRRKDDERSSVKHISLSILKEFQGVK